jgi:GNAT superfamily N-acetyltransferase
MSTTERSTGLYMAPLDLKSAGPEEYAALSTFDNRMRAERFPDDPPVPLEEVINRCRNIPDFVDVTKAVVWSPDGAIIASGETVIVRAEDNQHLAFMDIDVLPEHRRQGLARRLLAGVVDVAQREQRRLLQAQTNGRIPAGDIFMQRLQARKGLEGHTNQLDLAELDRALLRHWQERAGDRAEGFELGYWAGPYPEEELGAIVELLDVMNTAPRDNLDVEDFHWTRDEVRQVERSILAAGSERWTLYVRERATGSLAGFTEVTWNPNRPQLLEQWGTGVFPRYRNRGLGRWLKAAMLEKVLRDRPEVKTVRTGNADSNAPMLHINWELGFKPYLTESTWQFEVERAREYLAGKPAAVNIL